MPWLWLGQAEPFRELLGIALYLGFSSTLFVVVGIGIDDFGGVNTYYSVGEADRNPGSPMLAHGVAGVVSPPFVGGSGVAGLYSGRGTPTKLRF